MNWPQLGAILAVRRRNRDAGVKEVVKRRHSPRNRAPADALDGPTMLLTVEGRVQSEVVLKVLGLPPYQACSKGRVMVFFEVSSAFLNQFGPGLRVRDGQLNHRDGGCEKTIRHDASKYYFSGRVEISNF